MLEAGCGNVCIVCGDVVSRHSLPPASEALPFGRGRALAKQFDELQSAPEKNKYELTVPQKETCWLLTIIAVIDEVRA